MQGVQLALYLSSWEGTLISMRYMKENITTLANVGVRYVVRTRWMFTYKSRNGY